MRFLNNPSRLFNSHNTLCTLTNGNVLFLAFVIVAIIVVIIVAVVMRTKNSGGATGATEFGGAYMEDDWTANIGSAPADNSGDGNWGWSVYGAPRTEYRSSDIPPQAAYSDWAPDGDDVRDTNTSSGWFSYFGGPQPSQTQQMHKKHKHKKETPEEKAARLAREKAWKAMTPAQRAAAMLARKAKQIASGGDASGAVTTTKDAKKKDGRKHDRPADPAASV